MKNITVWLLIFILFVLEGTLIYWLIPSSWQNGLGLTSHFSLVAILYVTILRNRHVGLFFGLIFGIMHDIVYSSVMIGPHAFSMGLVAYFAGAIARRMKVTIASMLMTISFSILLYDAAIYALYRLFQVIASPISVVFIDYMIPTFLFNLLFAIVIYVPVRKWIVKDLERREEE